MQHRSTDSSTVSVQVKREVPITWLLSGLAAIMVAGAAWAWQNSTSMNALVAAQAQQNRDFVQLKADLTEIKSDGKKTIDEMTRAAIRNVEGTAKISDLERRVNMIESQRAAGR